MKSSLPTDSDIRKILIKRQRRKNIIPAHAAATSILNAEIIKLYEYIENTTSYALRAEADYRLRRLLDQKKQAEDIIVEQSRIRLENYILNPPKKLRIKVKDEAERRILTWNKRRSTLLLFDEMCALKLRQSFHVEYFGRDQLIRILIDGLVGTEANRTCSQRSILRVDIKNFYESINRAKLIKKISRHSGVPEYITEHVRRIDDSMQRINDRFKTCGLPNGVSSSAVLSEIYLEKLDSAIRNHAAVAIYLRYNDDIVVICEPGWEDDVKNCIDQELKKIDLEISDQKAKYKLIKHPENFESGFEYLGYKFNFNHPKRHLSSIDISTNKYNRLRRAVDNVSDLIGRVSCMASGPGIENVMTSVDYLLSPHFSDPGAGATRIVSGLAYSAKFVGQSPQSPINMTDFLSYAKSQIMSQASKKVNVNGISSICKCCGLIVPEKYDLMHLMGEMTKLDVVLHKPAVRHKHEHDRRRAFDLLWK